MFKTPCKAMNEYYRIKKRDMKPYFINKGLRVPLRDHEDFKSDIAPYDFDRTEPMAHLPWNYVMDMENLTNYFISNGKIGGVSNTVINVINLNKRPDRMAELMHVLPPLNFLKPTRVEAVEAKPGFIGCALSHIKCIEQALEDGLPYCIVMEDDAMPVCRNFEVRLIQVLSFLEKNLNKWEVFNSFPVGDNFDMIHKVLSAKDGIVETFGGLNTHFMIYNVSKVGKELVALKDRYLDSKNHNREAEGKLAWDEYLARNCRTCTALPLMTIAYSEDSDITRNGLAHLQVQRHFDQGWKYQLQHWKLRKFRFSPNSDVTMCLTSCNRFGELHRTLESFFKYNTYPLRHLYISEDGDLARAQEVLQCFLEMYELTQYSDNITLYGGEHNQIDSIDKLYSKVETPYIFHCEDDWVFTRSFFIEQSKCILEKSPKIFNVWLRDINSTNLHPLEKLVNIAGYQCFLLAEHYNSDWHGFTFNPHLFRKSDYVGSYRQLVDSKSDPNRKIIPEAVISNHYHGLGYRSVILPMAYCYHIGYHSNYQ